ncbi:MAG: ferrous iron transport protein A, partial [Dactylosporangium sp.]|nr:ferrous iron transport protein A [Dactylosporangium sp.]NNJ60575.1 ferrous iron transport protein A [Dactylosporangium sp.]
MTLDQAPSGHPVTIDRPDAATARTRRLAEMGLRAGTTVTPAHRVAGGGRIVRIGAVRVAVARAVLARLSLRDQRSDTATPDTAPSAAADPGVADGTGRSEISGHQPVPAHRGC